MPKHAASQSRQTGGGPAGGVRVPLLEGCVSAHVEGGARPLRGGLRRLRLRRQRLLQEAQGEEQDIAAIVT